MNYEHCTMIVDHTTNHMTHTNRGLLIIFMDHTNHTNNTNHTNHTHHISY